MTTNPTLTNLLPAFRQCDNYADRLAFWKEHGLTAELCYVTVEVEDYPVDFVNQLINCRTWESVKQLPILTLTPFTPDEAQQFVDWALQIRPGMSSAPQTADAIISEFQQEYVEQPFKHLRDDLISNYREASRFWLNGRLCFWRDDRLHEDYAFSKNGLRMNGINPELFDTFMHEQAGRRPIDLAYRIAPYNVDMSWKPVDTYLFAKAKYDFAVFLEQFDPANITPATSAAMANDGPGKERQQRQATIARDKRIEEYVQNFMRLESKTRPEAMQLAAEKEGVGLDTVERALGLRKR